MSALQVESEVVGERVEGLSDGLKRTSHVNKHTKVGNYRHSWGVEGRVKRLIFSRKVICIQDAGIKLRKMVAD